MVNFPQAQLIITDTVPELQKRLLDFVGEKFTKILKAAGRRIDRRIKELVEVELKNTDLYAAFKRGDRIVAELGVKDASTKLDNIIDTWLESIQTTVTPVKRRGSSSLSGGMKIQGIVSDYSDVFAMPESYTMTKKGAKLDWLMWLLEMGSTTIIREYEFKAGGNQGRTRGGIMVVGQSWKVPEDYVGYPDDNFLTNALDRLQDTIDNIVQDEIQRRF